jgi:heat shock protein HtpX
MVASLGLLAVVYAAAIVVLVVVLRGAWPIGVAVVAAFLFFQLTTSDRVVLKTMRAREVTPEEYPELHATVDRLCALAGMNKPRLAVADSKVSNAFAAGRSRKRTVLCVTTGMLDQLEQPELEAVVAHELSHIAHDDVIVMTVASFLGVLAGLTVRLGARVLYVGGRARGAWHLLAAAFAILALATITWFLSTLLIRALSRYREYAADRAAAQLTGNPAMLAQALLKVSGPGGRIPVADLRRAAPLNAFHFCPVTVDKRLPAGLLSTHPSVQRRVDRLAELSVQFNRPA